MMPGFLRTNHHGSFTVMLDWFAHTPGWHFEASEHQVALHLGPLLVTIIRPAYVP